MKMRSLLVYYMFPICLMICSASAQASLIGEDVYGCLVSSFLRDCYASPPFGNIFSPDTAVISDLTTEFATSGDFIMTANFGEDTLRLEFRFEGATGGALTTLWYFEFLDMQQSITDVEFINSNTFLSNLAFTSNSISVDTNTTTIGPGQSLFWEFEVSTVPEPSSLSLIGLGLAFSLVGRVRKKNQRQTYGILRSVQ